MPEHVRGEEKGGFTTVLAAEKFVSLKQKRENRKGVECSAEAERDL